MNHDRAPWPIIAGTAAFAAAAAWFANQTSYDVAAATGWVTAALSAFIAARFTAEHIVDRIRARTRQPAPAPALDPLEAAILTAHGFTEPEWTNLTNQQRAHYRSTYTKAERFIR